MSEWELPNLRGVGDRLIVDVAKPSHVANEIFFLGHSHRGRQLLSLGFSESSDYRGMNLAGRTCKSKQCTDGGVSAGSPMLKLDREI